MHNEGVKLSILRHRRHRSAAAAKRLPGNGVAMLMRRRSWFKSNGSASLWEDHGHTTVSGESY